MFKVASITTLFHISRTSVELADANLLNFKVIISNGKPYDY